MKRYLLSFGLLLSRIPLVACDANFVVGEINSGNEEKVHDCLKKGFDVNGLSGTEHTPLMAASQYGFKELDGVVSALLSHKADPNIKGPNGYTALIYASERSGSKVIKALLDAGANPNAKNSYGRTALHFASPRPDAQMTALLLAKGANANAKDSDGRTPLIYAVENCSSGGCLKALEALVANKADVNAQDAHGKTALMISAARDWTDVSEFLISKGAQLELKDDSGFTALIAAMFANADKSTTQLLEAGADVNARATGDEGNTALLQAVVQRKDEYVKAVLAKGPNLETRNNDGYTPLLRAVLGGSGAGIVGMLVSKGADVNAQDKYGNTPITLLVQQNYGGYEQYAKALLAGKPDIHIKNKEGKTAMDIARSRGFTEVVELLEKAPAPAPRKAQSPMPSSPSTEKPSSSDSSERSGGSTSSGKDAVKSTLGKMKGLFKN